MKTHSRLLSMKIQHLGCIGQEGLEISLSQIVCLVGPNNAGKSTVLRAYELAVTNGKIEESDICQHSPTGSLPTVELVMHIPENTPNISDEWIEVEGEHRKLTSRWTWQGAGSSPARSTYHPVEKWETTKKASGLDAVFLSRLPQAFRIGSLDGPGDEEKRLIDAVLAPISRELSRRQQEDSDLKEKLQAAFLAAEAAVKELSEDLAIVESTLNRRLSGVFPALPVSIRPSLGANELDLGLLLKKNSVLRVNDQGTDLPSKKQGTGTQRALFWSLLAARAELERVFDARRTKQKTEQEHALRLPILPVEIETAKDALSTAEDAARVANGILEAATTPAKKEAAQKKLDREGGKVVIAKSKLEALVEELSRIESGQTDDGTPSSGYMLLIDEPETALHPNAIRAAREYLYGMAENDGWQIMLTTHSPVFVDPTLDQTTIVRLERSSGSTSPRTFRAASSGFTGDEKERLKQLMHFDTGLAEMFFGGYPIVIEGDTEFAAFGECMRLDSSIVPVERRPVLIRARGKDAIVLIIRVLRHFKVDFSVLHDSDGPRSSNQKRNPAWSANGRIYEQLLAAHLDDEIRVVHGVSVPDFERHHGLKMRGKDKPWRTWKKVRDNASTRTSVSNTLKALLPGNNPISIDVVDRSDQSKREELVRLFVDVELRNRVKKWVSDTKNTSPVFDFMPLTADASNEVDDSATDDTIDAA